MWVSSQVGLVMLASDDPRQRVSELLADDAQYACVYRQVLQACSRVDGATAKELDRALYDHPLLQEPRLFAAHFFDRLDECGALVWDGAWKTTQVGHEALSTIEDVLGETGLAQERSE